MMENFAFAGRFFVFFAFGGKNYLLLTSLRFDLKHWYKLIIKYEDQIW